MKKIFLGLLVVYFMMMTSAAYAFNPAHLEQLRKTKKCPNCDLSNANLSDAFLYGANLTQTNLTDANLSNAHLKGANLSGAKLYYAKLERANLSDANLHDADLGGAYLRNADLSKADLSKANLSLANLSGAKLDGAQMSGAHLTDANLSNAFLKGANLNNANLSGAKLDGATGVECDFSLSPNIRNQKCFGGSGNQCQGGDINHPITLNNTNCTAKGYVTIGSIMHDNCCVSNPTGYACTGGSWDLLVGRGFGQSDRETCGQEWNKAWNDSIDKRGWEVTFGPYVKGGLTDDLTSQPARNAMVYDAHGNFKRMWHEKSTSDPARWGNKTDKPLQETVSSQKLKAPAGTKFEFKEDEAFCASGRWADGKCQ